MSGERRDRQISMAEILGVLTAICGVAAVVSHAWLNWSEMTFVSQRSHLGLAGFVGIPLIAAMAGFVLSGRRWADVAARWGLAVGSLWLLVWMH